MATRALERAGPKLTGRAAALLVAVTLLVLLAIVPARNLLQQRSRIAGLERNIAQLQQDNARLRQQVATLHDPAELERLARECLGMVGPGETALVVGGTSPDRTEC